MSEHPYIVTVEGERDFEEKVIAASRERPVLVDFWAAWCGPCQMLMPILAQVVEDYQGQVLLAKVNSDENQELAARYGVRSLPTVMLFKDGQPVDQFMGAVPASQVRAFVDRHLPQESDFAHRDALALLEAGQREAALAALEANLERHPRHLPTARSLARLYLDLGRLEDARRLLEGVLAAEDDDTVAALRARLELTRLAQEVPDAKAALATDPHDPAARLARGAQRFLEGRFQEALEDFLDVLERHRGYGDGAARRALLAAFALLGEQEPLVSEYRAKMARLLY